MARSRSSGRVRSSPLDMFYSRACIFDFYRFEMPNFGWKEITSIRSDVSLLTYDRGGRVANIRITRTKVSGAEVWITVSPKRDTSGSVK